MDQYSFQQRQRRISSLLLWRRLAASLVLDTIVVFILLYIFDDDYDPGIKISEIAIGVGLLWIGEIIFAVRRWLWVFVSMVVVEPKLFKVELLDSLRAAKLNWPDYLAARFHSLKDIADDPELDAEMRVRAAYLYGASSASMNLRGSAAAVTLEGCWDDAIREYVAEQPKGMRAKKEANIKNIAFEADD